MLASLRDAHALVEEVRVFEGCRCYRFKISKVQIRRACNKSLRHAMHLFAHKSTEQCTWAKVYYQTLLGKGKSHAQALRALGQRWIKIIWKMWQTRTCYDAELHLKNQLAHGSWVLKVQPSTTPKPCA